MATRTRIPEKHRFPALNFIVELGSNLESNESFLNEIDRGWFIFGFGGAVVMLVGKKWEKGLGPYGWLTRLSRAARTSEAFWCSEISS